MQSIFKFTLIITKDWFETKDFIEQWLKIKKITGKRPSKNLQRISFYKILIVLILILTVDLLCNVCFFPIMSDL